MPRLAAASLLVLLSLAPRDVGAQEPKRREIQLFMGGKPVYDLAWMTLATSGWLAGTYLFTPPRVDRAPLDGVGRRERSKPLGTAADASLRVGLGVGAGLAFLTELGDGSRGKDLARAPLIMIEGAMAASALTQLVKNLLGICRPRDWDPYERRCAPTADSEPSSDPEEREHEARRSFPSGHNAPLAGMAGAALGLYVLPSDRRPAYLPVALTSTGFALTTVLLRERAGAHSWVDTLAAFVTGGAAGFATAALHVKTTRKPTAAAAVEPPSSAPTMLTFGGIF